MAERRLTTKEVIERIRLGGPEGQFMASFVKNDLGLCQKFIDASPLPFTGLSADTSGGLPAEVPTDVAKGETTGLTADILIKVAAIAINAPDYHVVALKPSEDGTMENSGDCAKVGRQYLRDEWDKKNWARIAKMALLKRYVCGLGCVRYSWANGGVEWSNVQSWDLCIDPFTIDWQNPEWGGCRIRLSRRKAKERYPRADFSKSVGNNPASEIDSEKVEIWLYWDKFREIHIYGEDKILDEPNQYGVVPLLFLEGDLHPGKSPFPLGDMVLAAGAEAEVSDLTGMVSNIAKNGSTINCFDPNGMDKGTVEKLENGDVNQWLAIKGMDALNRPPIWRVEAEQLSPAILEAIRRAENYRDGIVGIGGYDRGVTDQKPSFATEVYAQMSRGGARKNQSQTEFETFMDRWARITIALTKEFGGSWKHNGIELATAEQKELHDNIKYITEVHVLEGSTVYREPQMEQQASLQLYQMVLQGYPLMLQLSMIGAMPKLPDLVKLLDRVYRSFGVNETEQMWVQPPQMNQPQEEKKPLVTYKDAPEDIRRQQEAREGYQPSQIGGMVGDDTEEEDTETPHLIDLEKQKRDHQFQLHSQVIKQIHELGLEQMKLENQRQIASQDAIVSRANNQENTKASLMASKERSKNGKGKS